MRRIITLLWLVELFLISSVIGWYRYRLMLLLAHVRILASFLGTGSNDEIWVFTIRLRLKWFHRHFSYQFLNTDNTRTSQISSLSEPNKTFNFTLWREGIVKIGIYFTLSQGGELDLDIFFVILGWGVQKLF